MRGRERAQDVGAPPSVVFGNPYEIRTVRPGVRIHQDDGVCRQSGSTVKSANVWDCRTPRREGEGWPGGCEARARLAEMLAKRHRPPGRQNVVEARAVD